MYHNSLISSINSSNKCKLSRSRPPSWPTFIRCSDWTMPPSNWNSSHRLMKKSRRKSPRPFTSRSRSKLLGSKPNLKKNSRLPSCCATTRLRRSARPGAATTSTRLHSLKMILNKVCPRWPMPCFRSSSRLITSIEVQQQPLALPMRHTLLRNQSSRSRRNRWVTSKLSLKCFIWTSIKCCCGSNKRALNSLSFQTLSSKATRSILKSSSVLDLQKLLQFTRLKMSAWRTSQEEKQYLIPPLSSTWPVTDSKLSESLLSHT